MAARTYGGFKSQKLHDHYFGIKQLWIDNMKSNPVCNTSLYLGLDYKDSPLYVATSTSLSPCLQLHLADLLRPATESRRY